ncbi:MAG TPA: lamin tail domain-containing protein [Gemmatimonadaceae bacterium]|nr:lamin tail domain-containing protein [Gemmatimonadaceae bacterium]
MKILAPLPLLLVALTLSGCEDAAAPEGQPGDLTVAAYIDNDASGSLTTGDTPLANFEIAVLRDGQEVASGTTAADGRVTFADLAPGSYVIEPGGPVPTGATLTSNPSPSAVIDFRGRSVSVDFRYAMFPGLVEGRVFRDENGNGTFEQGTDVPGPGLWVFLRADTGAVGAKLDSVRTDSLGAYRFRLVPPGDYYLEFERLGAINYGAAGATRQITVVGAASTTLNVLYTGSIFVTVRQARATPVDTTVAVIGDITVPPGVFNGSTPGANSEIWVQDTTGGIAAFPVPTADSASLRLGTRIEVVGPITLFSGQKQIGRTGAAPTIRIRTGGAQVAPKPNTAAEARSLADEGRLVTVSGLRIDSVPGGTGGAFNVRTVSATNDTLTIRVNGTATGLTRASFVVGERYSITGILTQFNGTAQLKPRFATDVAQIVVTPTARVIINEFMANPGVATDANGEYIELHNWGTAAANLENWTIQDNAATDTINISLVIPAGGYVLLAINGDPLVNGGLTEDFVYQRLALAQAGDRIVLKDPTGAVVDSVNYTSGQSANGVAWGVRDPSADNLDASGANWQAQTSTFGPGATPDKGTPGTQNDGYITPTQPTPLVGRADGISPLNKKQQ